MRIASAVLACGFLLVSGPAFAALSLTGASPSADSVAQGAPTAVELTFNGHIAASRSSIAVRDAVGTRYDRGHPYIVNDPQHIAIAIKELVPGRYTVQWKVAAPGSLAHGNYSFEVAQ